MKKLALLVAAIAAIPALLVSPVFADSPGQLSNGANNYKVRNVTTNGDYSQHVAAACGDTVKYSVTLANSDYGLLKNLTVKANLGSGVISASATNTEGNMTSVSGSATVALAKGSLQYVPGSTVRITSDGTKTTNLSDGVTNGGVNVGDLNGSTQIFVQFQAKVNCPTPPKQIQVCQLDTKKIVTINESDFDSKKYSKNLADCAQTPKPGEITVCNVETGKVVTIKENDFDSAKYTKDLSKCAEKVTTVTELPHTGPTSGIFAGIGLSVVTAGVAYFLQRRKILG